jgi:hypothetical protein
VRVKPAVPPPNQAAGPEAALEAAPEAPPAAASASVTVPVIGAERVEMGQLQFVDEFGNPYQVVVNQGPPPLPGMGILY